MAHEYPLFTEVKKYLSSIQDLEPKGPTDHHKATRRANGNCQNGSQCVVQMRAPSSTLHLGQLLVGWLQLDSEIMDPGVVEGIFGKGSLEKNAKLELLSTLRKFISWMEPKFCFTSENRLFQDYSPPHLAMATCIPFMWRRQRLKRPKRSSHDKMDSHNTNIPYWMLPFAMTELIFTYSKWEVGPCICTGIGTGRLGSYFVVA